MHAQGRKQEVVYMLGLRKSIFSFHLLLLPIIYLSCHYDSLKIHSLIYSTLPEERSMCVCTYVYIWRWGMDVRVRVNVYEREREENPAYANTRLSGKHALLHSYKLITCLCFSVCVSVCLFKAFRLKRWTSDASRAIGDKVLPHHHFWSCLNV